MDERHLISRNKREGWYVGWRPNLRDRRHGYEGPPRHRRRGPRDNAAAPPEGKGTK